MYYRFLLICFLLAFQGYSQNTIYINAKKEVVAQEVAEFYLKTQQDNSNPEHTIETRYSMDGEIKEKIWYANYAKRKKTLVKRQYFRSGKLRSETIYYGKKWNSRDFIVYYENGKVRRKDSYSKGKFISGTCWNENGEIEDYYPFEVGPKFPGGKEALYSYIQLYMSQYNIPANVKGQKVTLKFAIQPDGSISNLEMISGTKNPEVNYWVTKTIMDMPNWSPAKQDGKPVKVTRVIPITF